jgi:hypothetical protein
MKAGGNQFRSRTTRPAHETLVFRRNTTGTALGTTGLMKDDTMQAE